MQGTNFITQYRTATVQLLTALESLASLRGEYIALDLGNTLTDDDFAQGHSDIVKADLVAAEVSNAAFATLLSQGHATNLYKMKS